MRALVVALAGLALAPAALDTPLVLQPQSRVWVDGNSTVRRFSCAAGVVHADVRAAPGAVAAVLAGEKAVRTVEVRIPAARLDCRNGTMNEHMLKALKAKDHAEIVFAAERYDLVAEEGAVRGTLAGTLTLGGVARAVAVEARGAWAGDEALRVTGRHTLRLSDHGLKAPSLMLGTMRVDDAVTVAFDLVLKGEPVVAASAKH
jgi:polyisoprenoid-binding protein YceI